MHSEWSAEHVTPPSAPTRPVGAPHADAGFPAAPHDADVVDVGVTPATGADPSGAEEELHRTAVDAVDGLLDEVELALARLDDGTYGRCEECGAPIDDARLAELPIVRTCGRCDEVDAPATVAGEAAPVTA